MPHLNQQVAIVRNERDRLWRDVTLMRKRLEVLVTLHESHFTLHESQVFENNVKHFFVKKIVHSRN